MRYVSSAITCTICLVAIFGFTACSDENYDHVASSDILQFAASVNDAKNVSSEELAAETRAAGMPQRIESASDTLFISPLYEPAFRGGLAQKAVKDNKKAVTRGTQITSTAAMTNIGVSCYYGTTSVFTNIKASKAAGTSNNFVLSTEQKNMPTDGSAITYYAYQPYANSSVVYDGYKTIKYTVPNAGGTANTDQPDILYASNTGSAKDKTIKLAFNHALTAVRFIIGNDLLSGTIKRITLKNIYGYGELDLATGAWSKLGTQTSFSVTGSKKVTTANAVLTDNGEYFMMIPQTLTNATVEIEYSDSYTPNKVLTQSITGTWAAGTTVTYAIGSSKVKIVTVTATFPKTYSKTIQGSSLLAVPEYPVKKAYAKNDVLGLSIVDKNNNVVLANYPVTFNGTSWTTANTLIHRDGYKYFMYYPYKATYSSDISKVGTSNSSTAAENFYSNLAKNFTLASKQTSIDLLNANDLQTGTGTYNSSTHVVSFSKMRHEFGMHSLVQYRLINTPNPYNFNGDVDKNTNYFAKGANQPFYSETDNRYFFMVKPSSNKTPFVFTFNGKDTNVNAPAITEADECNYDGLIDYQITASDIYYPDGALSHYGTVYKTKTPLALVYTTNMTTYEKNQKLTHARALCLKDAGVNKMWYSDYNTDQSSLKNWYNNFNYVTPRDKVDINHVINDVVNDNCGLEQYDALVGKSTSNDAFGTVKAFAQQYSKAQGRIFLPSIGELFNAFNTLGSNYLSNLSATLLYCNRSINWPSVGDSCDLPYWTEYYYAEGSASGFAKYFDNYLKNSGISSTDYSTTIDGSTDNCYWTSSEFFSTHAMSLLFGWGNRVWPSGFNHKGLKYQVRAMIAF